MKYQLLLFCALLAPAVRAESVVSESAPMSAKLDLRKQSQVVVAPGDELFDCAWNNTDDWARGGDPSGSAASIRVVPVNPSADAAIAESTTVVCGAGEGVVAAIPAAFGHYRLDLMRGGEVIESRRVDRAGVWADSETVTLQLDTRELAVRPVVASATDLCDFACNNTADWARGGDPSAAVPSVRITEMDVNGRPDDVTAWTDRRIVEDGIPSCAAAEGVIAWTCPLPSFFRADLMVGGAVVSSAYFDFTWCRDSTMPWNVASLNYENLSFEVIRTGDGDRVEAVLLDDEGRPLRQGAGDGFDFDVEMLGAARRGENLRMRIIGSGDWYGSVEIERNVVEIVFGPAELTAGLDTRERTDGVRVLGSRENLLALAWTNDEDWRRDGGGETASATVVATPVMPVAAGDEVVWLDAGEGETLVERTGEGACPWSPSGDYYRLTLAKDGDIFEQAIVDMAAVREMGTLAVENGSWPQVGEPLRLIATSADGGTSVPLAANWTRKSADRSEGVVLAADATEYVPTAADLESWLAIEVLAADGTLEFSRELWFSKLPVVYVTTDDGGMPTAAKEEHSGAVRVQGNAKWSKDKYLYDGALEKVHVRGNSTSGYPKKPYKLKLGKKADLLGMGKNKHWVLLANWQDPGLMRNKTAYDLSAELGLTAMASEWVEVVFNGAFLGNYQLCEHIRIDKERINIHNWEDTAEETAVELAAAVIPEKGEARSALEEALVDSMTADLSWLTTGVHVLGGVTYVLADYGIDVSQFDLSGGYVYELDAYDDELSKFRVTSGKIKNSLVKVNSPETLHSNQTLMDAQRALWTGFFDAVQSENGYAGGRSWAEMADVRSMAAYWLTQVLVANPDVPRSRYAYRDQGGPLVFGPAWDFDAAFGGWAQQWRLYGDANGITSATQGNAYTGWLNGFSDVGVWSSPNDNFYPLWVDDPYFCLALYELWQSKRAYLRELVADGGTLDRNYDYLLESGRANDALWPVQSAGTARDRFDGELGSARRMKACLKEQIEWIDAQMASLGTLVASLKSATSDHPYADGHATFRMSFADGVRRETSDETFTPDLIVNEGKDLAGQVSVDDATAVSAEVYVNGIAICTNPIANGTVSYSVPRTALTATGCRRNLIALIARNASGDVCGTTYALVSAVAPSERPYRAVPSTVDLADDEADPTGNPQVRVRLPDGRVLVEGRDYRVSFEDKSATEVKVVVTGLGSDGDIDLADGQVNYVGELTLVYESGLRVRPAAAARRQLALDTRTDAVRKIVDRKDVLPLAWNSAADWPRGGDAGATVTMALQPMTGADPSDPTGWAEAGAAKALLNAAGEGVRTPRFLERKLYKMTLGNGASIDETAYFDLTEMTKGPGTVLFLR